LAQRILEHRDEHGPFQRVEDLDKVNGIGPKTVEKLRPWLFIEEPKAE
jgi:competence protein ComEA